MGKQTDKSRYQSRYSPQKYVTAAQYIIELICEKKARIDKVDLPIQFWKQPEWQTFFKSQLRKCHSLLKKYHEKAIIRALQDSKLYSVYSLHAPWLIPVVEKYQKIVLFEIQNRQNTNIDKAMVDDKPLRPRRVAKTTLSQLRDLDG